MNAVQQAIDSSVFRHQDPQQRDNVRFMRVDLRDDQPVPKRVIKPSKRSVEFRLKSYYRGDLAALYGETSDFFAEMYLHVPSLLPTLEGLGYVKGKTQLLTRTMVKAVLTIHGNPLDDAV